MLIDFVAMSEEKRFLLDEVLDANLRRMTTCIICELNCLSPGNHAPNDNVISGWRREDDAEETVPVMCRVFTEVICCFR